MVSDTLLGPTARTLPDCRETAAALQQSSRAVRGRARTSTYEFCGSAVALQHVRDELS